MGARRIFFKIWGQKFPSGSRGGAPERKQLFILDIRGKGQLKVTNIWQCVHLLHMCSQNCSDILVMKIISGLVLVFFVTFTLS